jgi:hypothetical protein
MYMQPETTMIHQIPQKPRVNFANQEMDIASSIIPFSNKPETTAPSSAAFVQEKHQRIELPGMVD